MAVISKCRQSRTRLCPYAADGFHSSCCYQCHLSRHERDVVHTRNCRHLLWHHPVVPPPEAVEPEVEPQAAEPEADAPVTPDPRCVLGHYSRRGLIVTLGMQNTYGRQLLAWWNAPGYHFASELIDVRLWLDPHAGRGGLWGTHRTTQDRIAQSQGFRENLLSLVIGRILLFPVTALVCTQGHHRSVAVAEIAATEIRAMSIPVEVVHVDAGVCTAEQWELLLNLRMEI